MTIAAEQKSRTGLRLGRRPDGAWAALLALSFALYYVVPGRAASLIVLALCAVLCYLRLEIALCLVPLAMPFFMVPKQLGHPTPEFALGETAIVLCAAAFAARVIYALARGDAGESSAALRRLVPRSLLGWAALLFLLAATAATLAAFNRHLALRQYREAILEPLVYAALVVAVLRDRRALLFALWSVVGGGVLVAILGLARRALRPNDAVGVVWSGNVPHPLHLIASVYGSPDNVALLLDRAIPVAAVLGLVALSRPATARSSRWPVYGAGAAVLLMALVELLTGSRAGIVTAIAVSLIAVMLWRGASRFLAGAGIVAVLAASAAVLWKVQHGLSTVTRLWVWQSALHMIRDHPLWGVGPDNFLYYYFNPRIALDPAHPRVNNCTAGQPLPATHYMLPQAWREPCLSHPHNILLDAWLSTGLPGLIALIVMLGAFAVLAWRNLQRDRPDAPARGVPVRGISMRGIQTRGVQIGAIAIVLATVGHGLVDNSIFLPDLAVDFWLAVALTLTSFE